MNLPRRANAAAWLLAIALASGATDARAQLFPSQFELSDSVHLDEVDSTVRAHLERVRAYIADSQWDEAVETLRQVIEGHGSKVIGATHHRYISLTDYCHLQIAALPEPALELYRQRVDPLAEKWYADGFAARQAGLLGNVVTQAFCSSWGDEALLALGELALEQGRPSAARGFWEKILERPAERVPATLYDKAIGNDQQDADETAKADRALLARWYQRDEATPAGYRLRHDSLLPDDVAARLVALWKRFGLTSSRLAYPGTSLPLADVRARLILASILEGSLGRARSELEAFNQLHADSQGMLEGRKQNYGAALERLIAEAEKWPAGKPRDDWPTFAGAPSRDRIVPRAIEVGNELWPPIVLGEPLVADVVNAQKFSFHRVAERADALLSYHPLVVSDLILINNQTQIFAFDLDTGKPAWPSEAKKPGEIYADDGPGTPLSRPNRGLGVPRFTMTAANGRLYARMGSQVTSRPVEAYEAHNGNLVCLDLGAQGRLMWKTAPDDEKWAFEGAPLIDGTDVYVAMRKSDVRPQAHIACFDAETGHRRWRTMICSAETPAGGQAEEITHNLLTLEQGTLYLNTNLGAVAALNARDGQVQWISLYSRAKRSSSSGQDKRAAHFYRDLNPCVYYRGLLLVAPGDSQSIFALDATTGQMLWETPLAEDAVHLLGVGAGNLIASGEHLWWIDVEGGKVVGRWPDQTPHGYGRGLLVGERIFWPTRETLYVFDQRITAGQQPRLRREPIPLVEGRGAGGGNLVVGHGMLLIATATRLHAFRPGRAPAVEPPPNRAAQAAHDQPAYRFFPRSPEAIATDVRIR